MRGTYATRRPDDRPAHIMVISDDGIATMFDADERGNSGWDIAGEALRRAGGGGSMVLNIHPGWEDLAPRVPAYVALQRARDEQGWALHRVSTWEELMDFARAFSQRHYADPGAQEARW
jgi:hypothetical protein